MNKAKWSYVDKIDMTEYVKNYKEEGSLEKLFLKSENIADYMKECILTRTRPDFIRRGYAKFPLYYLHEDFEKHMQDLKYNEETHRLLIAISGLLSTWVSRGAGIKTSTLRNHFGFNLFFYRDLIEQYGGPYCLKWHYEYDPKQFRNRHYVTFDEELFKEKIGER